MYSLDFGEANRCFERVGGVGKIEACIEPRREKRRSRNRRSRRKVARLYATRSIEAGQVVWAETPVSIASTFSCVGACTHAHLPENRGDADACEVSPELRCAISLLISARARVLEAFVARVPLGDAWPATRAEFAREPDLESCLLEHGYDVELAARLFYIVRFFSLGISPFGGHELGLGLYTMPILMLKHSCEPNVRMSVSGREATLVVVARRHIDAGEELRASHCGDAMLALETSAQRRGWLREARDFVCMCTRCEREDCAQRRCEDYKDVYPNWCILLRKLAVSDRVRLMATRYVCLERDQPLIAYWRNAVPLLRRAMSDEGLLVELCRQVAFCAFVDELIVTTLLSFEWSERDDEVLVFALAFANCYRLCLEALQRCGDETRLASATLFIVSGTATLCARHIGTPCAIQTCRLKFSRCNDEARRLYGTCGTTNSILDFQSAMRRELNFG